MAMSSKRGAFIVIEGLDRVGKSTQCRLLLDALIDQGLRAELLRFPDRSTAIGQVINNYLTAPSGGETGSTSPNDRLIHLLFSSNRWELVPHIENRLSSGVSLLVDRYAFSGAAYSAAKPGLSLSWCCHSDSGLPRPDLVVWLTLSPEQAKERAGYGDERYETCEFQKLVHANYEQLYDSAYWCRVSAAGNCDEVFDRLFPVVANCVSSDRAQHIYPLWPEKG